MELGEAAPLVVDPRRLLAREKRRPEVNSATCDGPTRGADRPARARTPPGARRRRRPRRRPRRQSSAKPRPVERDEPAKLREQRREPAVAAVRPERLQQLGPLDRSGGGGARGRRRGGVPGGRAARVSTRRRLDDERRAVRRAGLSSVPRPRQHSPKPGAVQRACQQPEGVAWRSRSRVSAGRRHRRDRGRGRSRRPASTCGTDHPELLDKVSRRGPARLDRGAIGRHG